jgi:hypothetical protein
MTRSRRTPRISGARSRRSDRTVVTRLCMRLVRREGRAGGHKRRDEPAPASTDVLGRHAQPRRAELPRCRHRRPRSRGRDRQELAGVPGGVPLMPGTRAWRAAQRTGAYAAPTAVTCVHQVHAFARRPHVPRPDDHGRRTAHRARNSANRPELAHLHRHREGLPREAVRRRRRQFLLEALGPRKVTGSTSRLTTSCRRRSGSSRGHARPQQRRRPQ